MRYLILAVLFQICLPGKAQESFKSQVYQSYIQCDLNRWQEALDEDELKFSNLESIYERAMGIYGFIGLCIDSNEKKRAKPYVEELVELSDYLISQNPQNPGFMALKAATLGFEMIYQVHRMMSLGPQSVKLLNTAQELAPRNPQVLVELGNQAWAMPKFFGGDKEQACQNYRLAITSLEKGSSDLDQNWYYLKIQMVLADWYEKTNLPNRSKGIYQKVLRLEPTFELAKKRLEML